jgi:hypothetical protein
VDAHGSPDVFLSTLRARWGNEEPRVAEAADRGFACLRARESAAKVAADVRADLTRWALS